MISERDIAERFSAIWKLHFPLLTPNFIRVFNESYVNTINKNYIPISDDIRPDLVAEYSFQLIKQSMEGNLSINEINKNQKIRTKLIEKVASTIWKNVDYKLEEINMSNLEFKEAELLAENTKYFIGKLNPKSVKFEQELKGSGFMQKVNCDISIDDCLIEVKTVNRNFSSSDLKQLFLYLALQYVSGDRTWKYGGLYNPRRGTFCKFKVSSLIYSLSGGKPPLEVFYDLLDSLNRDIRIDKKF